MQRLQQSEEILSVEVKQQISTVLSDLAVREYFYRQLRQLAPVYHIKVKYGKIYITIQYQKYKHFINMQLYGELQSPTKSKILIDSIYVIKIGRNYPLGSVRLYQIQGPLLPKIFDSRDIFNDVTGQSYHQSIRLKQILECLPPFQSKMALKSQNYLEMQNVGQFMIGDHFYYDQLAEFFEVLVLMRDKSDKKFYSFLGISQSHLLIFQQVARFESKKERSNESPKKKSKLEVEYEQQFSPTQKHKKIKLRQQQGTSRKLVLTSVAELQCMSNINYKSSSNQLIVMFKKYKRIKLYHESQEIQRSYVLSDPQLFLRNVLKFLPKYQNCEIIFEPTKKIEHSFMHQSSKTNDINEFYKVVQKIGECNKMQQALKQVDEYEKIKLIEDLTKIYQRLIQFFSARAHPYYLIFVNKIKYFYSNKKQE